MSFRRIVLALAIAGAASQPALALDKLKLAIGQRGLWDSSIAEAGDKLGIFKKHGLDLKIVDFESGAKMTQALAAGSIDIGDGAGTEIVLASKGVPENWNAKLLAFGGNTPQVFWCRGEVKGLDDLKGKKIGISSPGSLTDWLARKIAASNNWKAGDIMIVPMGEMRTRLAAMRGGDIAGAVTSVQEAYEIQNKGLGKVLMTFAEVVPNFITHVIFARDALITGEPDVVRRFLRGWFSVAAFMRSNRAATVKSIAATMRLSEKVIDETYALETGVLSVDGRFDPAALDVIRTSLKDLGILTYVPAAAGLYSGNFVPVKVG